MTDYEISQAGFLNTLENNWVQLTLDPNNWAKTEQSWTFLLFKELDWHDDEILKMTGELQKVDLSGNVNNSVEGDYQ